MAGPLGDLLGVNKLFVYLGFAIMLNGAFCFVRVYKSESEYIHNRNQIEETTKILDKDCKPQIQHIYYRINYYAIISLQGGDINE